jgi:hypothetical protein
MLLQLNADQKGRRRDRDGCNAASQASDRIGRGPPTTNLKNRSHGEAKMLSEKFFLVLETLRSHSPQDGSTRVVSTSRHVPIKLPEKAEKA